MEKQKYFEATAPSVYPPAYPGNTLQVDQQQTKQQLIQMQPQPVMMMAQPTQVIMAAGLSHLYHQNKYWKTIILKKVSQALICTPNEQTFFRLRYD